MHGNTTKKGLFGILGAGLLAIIAALSTGFFQSVGQHAGDAIIPNYSTNLKPQISDVPFSSATEAAQSPSAIAIPSEEEASTSAVEILRVQLVFGSQGSGVTRGDSCRLALESADRLARTQCEKISQEEKASSFQLENSSFNCKSCAKLSSGWRCIAQIKPDCVVFDTGA
jgi:microcompartment protein CcmL/EutN